MHLLILLFLAISSQAATLRMRIPASPITLDWTGQMTSVEAPLIVNLCEGLYRYEYPSEKLVPAIAASVKKSKDLKEYTFTLKSDAKWSDGRSIYAKDFVDGWQRLLSPQSTSIYTYYLFDIVNASDYHSKKISSFEKVGVEALNDRTLVVRFNRPQKNWEVTTAFWPLFPIRKDLIEKFGNNWWRAGTLVSSGPFVFNSLEPGKKAVLKKNPYYPKTRSNLDQIEMEFILNQEEAFQKYRRKEFPFLSSIPIETHLKDPGFHSIPLLKHDVIALNTDRYPLNDRLFRLAILSAINRNSLLQKTSAQFVKANRLIPPEMFEGKEDLSVPFDPVKAREYLKQSGVMIDSGFRIDFLTTLADPVYEISKSLAAQIEKHLGISVNVLAVKNQEFETFSNLGEYNLVFLSWTSKVKTPRDFLFPYSNVHSKNNRTRFVSEPFEKALEEGDLRKAQLIIAKENAVIHPLFFEKTGYLSHPSIQNLYFDYRGMAILRDVVLK